VQFTNRNGAFTGYALQNLRNTATSYSGMLFFDQRNYRERVRHCSRV
jgi:hypothetical protein